MKRWLFIITLGILFAFMNTTLTLAQPSVSLVLDGEILTNQQEITLEANKQYTLQASASEEIESTYINIRSDEIVLQSNQSSRPTLTITLTPGAYDLNVIGYIADEWASSAKVFVEVGGGQPSQETSSEPLELIDVGIGVLDPETNRLFSYTGSFIEFLTQEEADELIRQHQENQQPTTNDESEEDTEEEEESTTQTSTLPTRPEQETFIEECTYVYEQKQNTALEVNGIQVQMYFSDKTNLEVNDRREELEENINTADLILLLDPQENLHVKGQTQEQRKYLENQRSPAFMIRLAENFCREIDLLLQEYPSTEGGTFADEEELGSITQEENPKPKSEEEIYGPIEIPSIIFEDDSRVQQFTVYPDSDYQPSQLRIQLDNLHYEPATLVAYLEETREGGRRYQLAYTTLQYEEEGTGFWEVEELVFDVDVPLVEGEYKILVQVAQAGRTGERYWYGESQQDGLIQIIPDNYDEQEGTQADSFSTSLQEILRVANHRIEQSNSNENPLEPDVMMRLQESTGEIINLYAQAINQRQSHEELYKPIKELFYIYAEISELEQATEYLDYLFEELSTREEERLVQEFHQVIIESVANSNKAIYLDTLSSTILASNTIYPSNDEPGTSAWTSGLNALKQLVSNPFGLNINHLREGAQRTVLENRAYALKTTYPELFEHRLLVLRDQKKTLRQEINSQPNTPDSFVLQETFQNRLFTPGVLHDTSTYLEQASDYLLCDRHPTGYDGSRARILSEAHLEGCEALYAERVNQYYSYQNTFTNRGYQQDALFNQRTNRLQETLSHLDDEANRLNIRRYSSYAYYTLLSFAGGYATATIGLPALKAGVSSSIARGTIIGVAGTAFVGLTAAEVYQHYACFTYYRYEENDWYRHHDELNLEFEGQDLTARCWEELAYSVALYGSGGAGTVARLTPTSTGAKQIASTFAKPSNADKYSRGSLGRVTKTKRPTGQVASPLITRPTANAPKFMTDVETPRATYWKNQQDQAAQQFDELFPVNNLNSHEKKTFMMQVDELYQKAAAALRAQLPKASTSNPVYSENTITEMINNLLRSMEASTNRFTRATSQATSNVNQRIQNHLREVKESITQTFTNVLRSTHSANDPQRTLQQAIIDYENSPRFTQPRRSAQTPMQGSGAGRAAPRQQISQGAVNTAAVEGHEGAVQDAVYAITQRGAMGVADGVSSAGAESRQAAEILLRGRGSDKGLVEVLADSFERNGPNYQAVYNDLHTQSTILDSVIREQVGDVSSTVSVALVTPDNKLLLYAVGDGEARVIRSGSRGTQMFHVDQFTDRQTNLPAFTDLPLLSDTESFVTRIGSQTQSVFPNAPSQLGAGYGLQLEPYMGVVQLKPRDTVILSTDGLGKIHAQNPDQRNAWLIQSAARSQTSDELAQTIARQGQELMTQPHSSVDDLAVQVIMID